MSRRLIEGVTQYLSRTYEDANVVKRATFDRVKQLVQTSFLCVLASCQRLG